MTLARIADDRYDPPLEVEFPELWAVPDAWAEAMFGDLLPDKPAPDDEATA
jgi:hypothetical protein